MKLALKIVGGLVGIVVLVVAGTYLWASRATSQAFGRTLAAHSVDFPVPMPLDSTEVAQLRLTPDSANALALARAIERGRHLVEARYVCIECHGANFGGGTMIDDPMIGRLLAPNITTGQGGMTAAYTVADWDRIVRHGIRPGGTPAVMPSEDFQLMSDQELSDIIAYIRSQPPVDNEVPPISFGPLGKILVATGQFKASADVISSHDAPHISVPPVAAATVEFGKHLSGVCLGCHQADFAGGKIVGGDPTWVPARNLTPHETGLASWTLADFTRAMREGKRPDGTELQMPMSLVTPYARKMTEVELEALWMYLQSLPPVPARP